MCADEEDTEEKTSTRLRKRRKMADGSAQGGDQDEPRKQGSARFGMPSSRVAASLAPRIARALAVEV